MNLWKISLRSIQQRSLSSFLTALSMALGVALVVAVLVIHAKVDESFTNTARGYDMIVGAKGGKLQLTLNTVFHLSTPVENIPYSYYKEFTKDEVNGKVTRAGKFSHLVKAAIPYCLGDNYEGYRVVGTTPAMFDSIEYRRGKKYEFSSGRNFQQDEFFGAVVGSVVASRVGLKTGDSFQPTHGISDEEGHKHDAFKIVGVLAPTGTPNDRALFINMEGFYLLEKHAKPVPAGEKPVHDEHDEHNGHEEHEGDDHDHEQAGHEEHAESDHDHEADADHGEGHAGEAKGADHDHEDHDHEAEAGHAEANHSDKKTTNPTNTTNTEDSDHGDSDHHDADHDEHDGDHADDDHDHQEAGHQDAGHKDGDHGKDEHEDHAETGADHDHDEDADHDHEHGHSHDGPRKPLPENQREVTSILVLLDQNQSQIALIGLPNTINEGSVAQAVSPAREVYELLDTIVGPLRVLLLVLAGLIVVVAGVGVMVSIYNSMNERRRDIAIMRSLGAGRGTVMTIVLLESMLLSLAGGLAGFLLGHGAIGVLSPFVEARAGVVLGFGQFSIWEWVLIPALVTLASMVGYLPAVSAYRTDVAKVLTSAP